MNAFISVCMSKINFIFLLRVKCVMTFLLDMRGEGVTKKKSMQSLSSRGWQCYGRPKELENTTETIMFIEHILCASYYPEFSIHYLLSSFNGALMLVLSLSSLFQTRQSRLTLSHWPKDMMLVKWQTGVWPLACPVNKAWYFHLTLLHSHFELELFLSLIYFLLIQWVP